MVPELRERLNRLLPEPDLVSLNLKSSESITFDPVNVAWYPQTGYPQIYSLLSGGFPAWTARNEAFHQMRSAGSDLGLSPSARSGIRVNERNPKDPAAKYFT